MKNNRYTTHLASLFSALLLLSVSITSQAVPIVVNSSNSNVLVDESTGAAGTFDLGAAATAQGFSAPYSIASASVSFLFADDTDVRSTVYSLLYSQIFRLPDVCGSTLGSCQQRWYWLDTTEHRTTELGESARVTIGAQSATAASTRTTDYYSLGTVARGTTSCSFGCGFIPETRARCGSAFGVTFCDGPWPVYEASGVINDISTGSFSLTFALDAASILDLATDGLLDFSLSSVFGDFNFLSASLTADVIDEVNSPPVVTPVPEPSTLLTLCTGLFIIPLVRRKRKKLSMVNDQL